eukprot:13668156-Ditylum_brightwellii.AAC.1
MADRRTVEDLNRANEELAEANKQLTSQMDQINEKLDAITKLIKAIPTTDNNKKGGSCGYKVDKKHNSVTYPTKKDGHQDAATRSITMGGSQAGRQYH